LKTRDNNNEEKSGNCRKQAEAPLLVGDLREQDILRKIFFGGIAISFIAMLLGAFVSEGKFLTNAFHNFEDDTFGDFYNSIGDGLNPYERGLIYPPLMYVIYGIIELCFPADLRIDLVAIRTIQNVQILFLFYMIICIYAAAVVFRRIITEKGLLGYVLVFLTLVSYPMAFAYERGNSIIIAMVCLSVFLMEYKREGVRKHIAFICLAVSAGIKIYPAIFGLLLIREKRWKDTIIAVIYGIVFFFGPFLFMSGESRNPLYLVKNILHTNNDFSAIGYGWKIGTGALIRCFGQLVGMSHAGAIGTLVRLFLCTVGIVVVLLCKHAAQWQRFTILSLVLIEIPDFSFVYMLIFMICPALMFLYDKERIENFNRGINKKRDFIYTALFTCCMIAFPVTEQSFFESLADDYYKLNILTIFEGITVLVFMIFILADVIMNEWKCRVQSQTATVA